jgi:ABC-type dipeptide/oligopeptide/nickel transport system permease component
MGLVWQRLAATLELAGFAPGISILIALPIGILSAVWKGSGWDTAAKIIALLGQSLPAFWLGIVLMWVFAVMLDWLPSSGRGGFQHLILPAISLGWFQVAVIMRLVRSSMLEVLDSEFVKLARVKGIPEWKVVWKHCLRNASIAPLTVLYLWLLVICGDRKCRLAGRRIAGRGRRGWDGGAGCRDSLRRHLHPVQSAGRHTLCLSRPAHSVSMSNPKEARSCRN